VPARERIALTMTVQRRSKYLPQTGPNRKMLSDGLARFEPRNYGNVDRSFPVCRPPPDQSKISSNPRGLRGALFVHIASFVIPSRAIPGEGMSGRMTRLATVVKGRA